MPTSTTTGATTTTNATFLPLRQNDNMTFYINTTTLQLMIDFNEYVVTRRMYSIYVKTSKNESTGPRLRSSWSSILFRM